MVAIKYTGVFVKESTNSEAGGQRGGGEEIEKEKKV